MNEINRNSFQRGVQEKDSRDTIGLKDWQNLHVESFSNQMDMNEIIESPMLSWNWKNVAQSGCNTERRWRLNELCSDCDTRMIEVYVSSPKWTWENLCGRAGMLTFCPHCQKQIRFHLELMN